MSIQSIMAGQAFIKLAIQDKDFIGGVNRVVERLSLIDRNVQTFQQMSSGLNNATGSANLFGKALNFIKANPVTIAISALMLAFEGLKLWMEKSANEAKNASDHLNFLATASEKATNKMKASFKTDEDKVKRLKELELIENKNAQQMQESGALVDDLNSKYADLGLTFNSLTGEINGVSNAYRKMGEQQKKLMIEQLQRQVTNGTNSAEATVQSIAKSTDSAWVGRNANEKKMLRMLGYDFQKRIGIGGVVTETNMLAGKDKPTTAKQLQQALEFASANRGDLKAYIPELEKALAMIEKVERTQLELKDLQTQQTAFEKEQEKEVTAGALQKADESLEYIMQMTKGMTVGGYSGSNVMQEVWGVNTLYEQAQKATLSINKNVKKIADQGAVAYQ